MTTEWRAAMHGADFPSASARCKAPRLCGPYLVARSSAGTIVTVVHEATAADVIGRGKATSARSSARLAHRGTIGRVHGAAVAVHTNLHAVPIFVHVVAVPVSVSWMRVHPIGE